MKHLRPMLAFCVVAMMVPFAAGQAKTRPSKKLTNLLPDPNFQKPEKNWRMYEIELPSKVKYQKAAKGRPGSVTLTGGKTFLHSAAFDVKAGTSYRVACTAKGKGQVSVGILWWTEYSDTKIGTAKPHWTHQKKPTDVDAKGKRLSAVFKASEGAKRAYVRFVVTKGTVNLSNVAVSVGPVKEKKK